MQKSFQSRVQILSSGRHKHAQAHIQTAQYVQDLFWNDERKQSRVDVVRIIVYIYTLVLDIYVVLLPLFCRVGFGNASWSLLTTLGNLYFAVRRASSLATLFPHVSTRHCKPPQHHGFLRRGTQHGFKAICLKRMFRWPCLVSDSRLFFVLLVLTQSLSLSSRCTSLVEIPNAMLTVPLLAHSLQDYVGQEQPQEC